MSAGFLVMSLTGAQAAMPAPPIYVPVPAPGPPAPRMRHSPPSPPERRRPNLNAYFSPQDYPAVALQARAQGIVEVALVVGPNGRVSNCVVTRSSRSPALDHATCRILMSRARYTPALNAAGQPMMGRDRERIVWHLPAGSRSPR